MLSEPRNPQAPARPQVVPANAPRMPTARQVEVLQVCADHVKRTGRFPFVSELATLIGCSSKRSAAVHLIALRAKQCIVGQSITPFGHKCLALYAALSANA